MPIIIKVNSIYDKCLVFVSAKHLTNYKANQEVVPKQGRSQGRPGPPINKFASPPPPILTSSLFWRQLLLRMILSILCFVEAALCELFWLSLEKNKCMWKVRSLWGTKSEGVPLLFFCPRACKRTWDSCDIGYNMCSEMTSYSLDQCQFVTKFNAFL